MRYLPHTGEEVQAMLDVLGVSDLNALFSSIPDDCLRKAPMRLPPALTEWELEGHINALSRSMASAKDFKVYLGAGSYEHHIPQVVGYLLARGEFVTAYTPYQPEMSQGTLQAIYEYQTLVARLFGMEVANASMYDGASALAEALLMAIRITGKKTVAISRLVHPLYRQVVKTYFKPTGFDIVEMQSGKDGLTDFSNLDNIDDLAAVAVQSPNFFGCIETLAEIADAAHDSDALLVVGATEPLAYGRYKNPGSQGADIIAAEGQSLGIPQSFGGPGVGMFACNMVHVRNMPGRLVGKTQDLDGNRGFVLTLSTREQHIRREKATSNICTNHSLCAICAAMYMATLGKTGIRELAKLNYDKTMYLKQHLAAAGIQIPFHGPVFNEFVAVIDDKTHQRLQEKKIVAGLPIECYYPEFAGHYLMCVTETKTKADLDDLIREVTL
jgi:glycine dehydrogenase subunit 1